MAQRETDRTTAITGNGGSRECVEYCPRNRSGLSRVGRLRVIGFLLIRNQLYVPGDAATTAANLVDREGLARVGIAVDLASSPRRRWPHCGSTAFSERWTPSPQARSRPSGSSTRS